MLKRDGRSDHGEGRHPVFSQAAGRLTQYHPKYQKEPQDSTASATSVAQK